MGLLYNEETAVERDIKSDNYQNFTFFQDNTIEQEQQNNRRFYTLSANSNQTSTQTVTEEFICTGINVNIVHFDSVADTLIAIFIGVNNSNQIVMQSYSSAAENKVYNHFINIPNWKIKRNDVLILQTAAAAITYGQIYITFVGY